MGLIVNPLHPLFAAEIIGIDMTVEPTGEVVGTVEAAMAKYGMCVVRDCSLRDDDHIRFSRAFGPLELPPRMAPVAGMPPVRRRMRPELFGAGNLDQDGEIKKRTAQDISQGAQRFHQDSSFNTLPTKWSMLLGHEVPPPGFGGDTLFVDTRIAYQRLSEGMKAKIEDLTVIHDFWRGRELAGLTGVTDEQRATVPPVQHRLVRTMADGRKSMNIGGHASGIVGWPEDAALALLDELYAIATTPDMVYTHKWRQGDMTIWDNRTTLHAATPLPTDDYRRDMRRTTISEYGAEESYDWIAGAHRA